MIASHFKMNRQPFAEHAPVEQILQDERMTQGLARLKYFADEGTLAVVTGPTGSGKSSLLKLLLHVLSLNRFWPIYLHLTRVSASSLLKLIVAALGEEPRRGKERLFTQILDRTRKTDQTVLLVFDETHLIDPDALTDLRLLISSALDKAPPLKILLAGQDGLRDQLRRNRHADLVNRISVRYTLHPMTKDQSVAYIDHQMRYAGASDKVFDAEVKDLMHEYAHGIPRQINSLATACLLQAAIHKAQKVNEGLLTQVLSEFKMP